MTEQSCNGVLGYCKCGFLAVVIILFTGISALLHKNVNKKQVSEDSEKTEEAFDNK